jgi:AraC-like DNA-binding protein
MSRPTFSRQFRIHSGKTLGQFLQQIRLDAACRELAETNKPIIDIALGVGFSQVSFFNRVFRRSFGFSPTDFRRGCQIRESEHFATLRRGT